MLFSASRMLKHWPHLTWKADVCRRFWQLKDPVRTCYHANIQRRLNLLSYPAEFRWFRWLKDWNHQEMFVLKFFWISECGAGQHCVTEHKKQKKVRLDSWNRLVVAPATPMHRRRRGTQRAPSGARVAFRKSREERVWTDTDAPNCVDRDTSVHRTHLSEAPRIFLQFIVKLIRNPGAAWKHKTGFRCVTPFWSHIKNRLFVLFPGGFIVFLSEFPRIYPPGMAEKEHWSDRIIWNYWFRKRIDLLECWNHLLTATPGGQP